MRSSAKDGKVDTSWKRCTKDKRQKTKETGEIWLFDDIARPRQAHRRWWRAERGDDLGTGGLLVSGDLADGLARAF